MCVIFAYFFICIFWQGLEKDVPKCNRRRWSHSSDFQTEQVLIYMLAAKPWDRLFSVEAISRSCL